MTLTFGSYHTWTRTKTRSAWLAGSMAFKDGMRKAKTVLLEPMMAVWKRKRLRISWAT
ncbi:MAG: Translation elongation factor G [uncultured Caballeronia sp.]|nr:MAG: Translation elongation factor G [uncultured Caballeronia sp.]